MMIVNPYTGSSAPVDPWVGTTVTWNPADKGALWTLSNGDRTASHSASGTIELVRANTNRSTGKWYLEYFIEPTNNSNITSARGRPGLGIDNGATATTGAAIISANSVSLAMDGNVGNNTTYSNNYAGSAITIAVSDVIGLAVDFDALKIWFAKNNSWGGSPTAGTGNALNAAGTASALNVGSYFPAIASAFGGHVTARFKSADFTYSPPSGFTSWET